MTYLNEEMSLRGQTKLGICALRLCQMANQSDCDNDVTSETLVAFLRLLESPLAFNNVTLRHYIFCILQVLAGRSPTLFGVPRDETLMTRHAKTSSDLKNIFAALIGQSKPPASGIVSENAAANTPLVSEADKEGTSLIIEAETLPDAPPEPMNVVQLLPQDDSMVTDDHKILEIRNEQMEQPANVSVDNNVDPGASNKAADSLIIIPDHVPPVHEEASKEPDTVSQNCEFKKTKLKINLRKPSASTHVEDLDSSRNLNIRGSSSVSVNDPQPDIADTCNQNVVEDANSSHDVGSQVTLSIGSIKPVIEGDELVKDLQCTADSSKVSLPLVHDERVSILKIDTEPQTSEQTVSASVDRKREDEAKGSEGKEKRKHKDKKQKKSSNKDDSEHLEQKRQKKERKEKKRKEKEMAKILADNKTLSVNLPIHENITSVVNADALQGADAAIPSPARLDYSENAQVQTIDSRLDNSGNAQVETIDSQLDNSGSVKLETIDFAARLETPGNVQIRPTESNTDISVNPTQSAPSTKIRIKFKSRTLGEQ